MRSLFSAFSVIFWACQASGAFQPLQRSRPRGMALVRSTHVPRPPFAATTDATSHQPKRVLLLLGAKDEDETLETDARRTRGAAASIAALFLMGIPAPALAAAGPVPSAVLAWLHFLGIVGVAGGLVTERLVLKKDMSVDEENIINGADLIYGLSALSLLITGYFRVTDFAKGWEYYQHEPIFWLKMSSVAVLGGLSFFPAIVFFRRDMARKAGDTLPTLSDALVDRCSTIINAEILALLTIPLLASLMARGVLYMDNFPWPLGLGLYLVSLGTAGFKYGKEAFDMLESEGALVPIAKDDTSAKL